ncbi:DUF835 domain-containing protein [Thermococcus sp. M36]|uniref:DUF835 domain-containing protein n=1 Tax=Thermococcus sp. M36 TaxID=1638261 RepID=UPI001439F340|nr:DUF835 domain-containing protein [Thermococcus sp. M36]NJE05014.1 DUF835 domain-containing protein [Thermococcus sp. M36]
MEVHNPWGVIAGVVVLVVALFSAYMSYTYYRKFDTPLSKRLAKMALISSVSAIIGALGAMIVSYTETGMWWIMAVFFTVSYLTITVAVSIYLRLFYRSISGTVPDAIHEDAKPGEAAPYEAGLEEVLPRGGFTVQPQDAPKLKPLCRLAKGAIYVGRNRKPQMCPRFDKVIWISRIKAPNSVDPSKLHVLQESVIRFVSERGGGVIVILEGIEHLVIYNDFRSVIKFLTSLKDYMILTGSSLFVMVEEGTFESTETSILRREFPPIDLDEVLSKTEEIALFGALPRNIAENEKTADGDSEPSRASQ